MDLQKFIPSKYKLRNFKYKKKYIKHSTQRPSFKKIKPFHHPISTLRNNKAINDNLYKVISTEDYISKLCNKYKEGQIVPKTADDSMRVVKRGKTVLKMSNVVNISANEMSRANTSSEYRTVVKNRIREYFRTNTGLLHNQSANVDCITQFKGIRSSYRNSSVGILKDYSNISFNVRIFSRRPTVNFSLEGNHIPIHSSATRHKKITPIQ